MLLRLALAALLLFPLAGTAQELPSLAPAATPLVEQLLALDSGGQPLAHGSPVLPIWSGSNGQLLAVVALPRGWVSTSSTHLPAYAGAATWPLAGTRADVAGLRWQAGNGLHADVLLGQYLAMPPAPCTADDCAAATPWSRAALSGTLGLGWSSAEGGLDLSYGLSWLDADTTLTLPGLGAGSIGLPTLSLPGATPPRQLDNEAAMYARGRWQFAPGSAVDIAASYGRTRLGAAGGFADQLVPGIDLDQLSLSLGLDAGSLSGAVVGHVLSSDDPALAGKRWTTLDLGVSWRTPWSGELSVGAQNLWSAPAASPRDPESQARTPYIQYRQDL